MLQPAPAQHHAGLHGVFADSLPYGWRLLLQDRVFHFADWKQVQAHIQKSVEALSGFAAIASGLPKRKLPNLVCLTEILYI